MNTITNAIDIREYNLIGILNDERDMLDEFFNHSGSEYVCDIISEIADSFVPLYNSDVWDNASDIQEYIEEAISEGIVSIDNNNINLVRIFQAGYYLYYSGSLYNNLGTLAFNYVTEKTNEYLSKLSKSDFDKLDIDEIESYIEDKVSKFDNNDLMSDLDDIFNDVTEYISDELN